MNKKEKRIIIIYYSKKLINIELNYNIYNKELLAIVLVL
jgi:hypothetical protein